MQGPFDLYLNQIPKDVLKEELIIDKHNFKRFCVKFQF